MNACSNANENAPHRRCFVFAWLATFFAFAAVAHGNFETTDAAFTMHAAKNLWERGDSGFRRADQGATSESEQIGAFELHRGTCGKAGVNGLAYTWFPVGHVWLLVPFVALGDALGKALPGPEVSFRRHLVPGDGEYLSRIQGTPVLTQGLISLLIPPAFAATTVLLLFLLACQLGAGARGAAGCALAIVFATQSFAFGRETLSDGPGLAFLLAALLPVVAVHQGRGSPRASLLGGLAAGAATLLRYQNGALVLAIGVALLLAVRRQRRWRDLWSFAVGALPGALLLLAANHARFGSVFDTGYPETDAWLTEPIWLGTAKMLFGAGRGIAWCSPLAWLVLPLALRAQHAAALRWLGWLLFLFPLLFFARAQGWDGGQCWGARYATHGLVALCAIVLPQAQPWRHWPRAWWLLVALGLAANATSVVAPTRGVQQLGGQAAAALGIVADKQDAHDALGWQPQFTPLLANWRYAFASHAGCFEDAQGRPRDGAARAIEAVYGVDAKSEIQRQAPVRWEDRCGRHLWWRFWGDVLGVSSWLLLLPTVLLAALFAAFAHRDFRMAASDCSTAR